jgi:bifunctional oligoribonuclease and PAP phosphatase NrnA
MSLSKIANLLKRGNRFLFTTHKDPDGDGIGSMLALGKSLRLEGKEATFLTEEPLTSPFTHLKGAEEVVQRVDPCSSFDALIVLDCAERSRMGRVGGQIEGIRPLVNIDHHETNDLFGDLNYLDPKSSSTGEMIFRLIKRAKLPLPFEVAENLFVAIHTDTGSFRYSNTTAGAFKIASELMSYGVKPWEVSRKMTDHYTPSRLALLKMALGTIEFHYGGRIGMMTLSNHLYQEAHAQRADGERFIDFPRYVEGVEIAVLIRQTGKEEYKFSLRSNERVDVGQLALRFGGGGHARAAGFEGRGAVGSLKKEFLDEAIEFLNGKTH